MTTGIAKSIAGGVGIYILLGPLSFYYFYQSHPGSSHGYMACVGWQVRVEVLPSW